MESSADEWGRMEVRMPDGVDRFQVFYDLPWRRGLLMGAGLAAVTLIGFALVRNRSLNFLPLTRDQASLRGTMGVRRT